MYKIYNMIVTQILLFYLNFVNSKINEKDCRHMSQSGESEVIYDKFFSNPIKYDGVFVELGGFDGKKFSNSWYFEKCLGWRGLLLEGNPINFSKMVINRPDTMKMHMAICSEPQIVNFTLHGGAVAGSIKAMSPSFKNQWHHTQHPHSVEVFCGPIAHPLCLLGITYIDFFSIDVEGAELDVIQSIDFERIYIHVMIVEADNHNITKNNAVREIMQSQGFLIDTTSVKRSDLFINRNSYKHDPKNILKPCHNYRLFSNTNLLSLKNKDNGLHFLKRTEPIYKLESHLMKKQDKDLNNLQLPFNKNEYKMHGVKFSPQRCLHDIPFKIPLKYNYLSGREDSKNVPELKIPKYFSLCECQNAIIGKTSIVCKDKIDEKQIQNNNKYLLLSKNLILARDIFLYDNFQHSLINSIPTITMALNFLDNYDNAYIKNYSFLCTTIECLMLDSIVENKSRIIHQKEKIVYTPSLFVAFIPFIFNNSNSKWNSQNPIDLSFDAYPYGSLWLPKLFAQKFLNETNKPFRFLYLERPRHSRRSFINQDKVIDSLRDWSKKVNLEFTIFPHTIEHDLIESAKLFQESKIVFGIHGGSFSNIVFCNTESIIVEVNNVNGRNCFAAMSKELGLEYYRIPTTIPLYPGGGHHMNFNISQFFDISETFKL